MYIDPSWDEKDPRFLRSAPPFISSFFPTANRLGRKRNEEDAFPPNNKHASYRGIWQETRRIRFRATSSSCSSRHPFISMSLRFSWYIWRVKCCSNFTQNLRDCITRGLQYGNVYDYEDYGDPSDPHLHPSHLLFSIVTCDPWIDLPNFHSQNPLYLLMMHTIPHWLWSSYLSCGIPSRNTSRKHIPKEELKKKLIHRVGIYCYMKSLSDTWRHVFEWESTKFN